MGFLNPFLLFGVLSAAVPLLIHLWSRRQARTVEFSALRFILEAHRRTVRRFQLEHWLLLALRMLLLAFVAVALARPVAQAGGWFARARARTCAVIVLDNSASMGYRGVSGTAFEQAKARALDALRSLQPGDEAGIVLMSDEPVSLFEPPSTQLGDARQAVRSAPLTSRRTRVEGAIAHAVGLLKRSSAPNRELTVISDFAQTAWNISALDTEDARVFLVPVGGGEDANASVQAVRASNPLVAVNLPVAYEVTVTNWGTTPMTNRAFEFIVDGEARASRAVNVPPKSEIRERVTHTFDSPGLHTIRVRLDGDRLPDDDVRDLVVRVVGGVRATVVGNDTLFLSLALNPNGEPNARAAILPSVVSPSAFAGASLDATDALVLQNPSLTDARVLARMENYLLNGGVCVVCLGAGTPSFRGVDWLPVESDGVVRFARPAKLRPSDSEPASRRLFELFREDPWAKPSAPNFYQAHRLRARGSAKVLARFDDGTPALVDAAVKRGRLIILNSPASRSDWSNLPLSPLFVPLVQQIALSAVAESTPPPASLEVGDTYERALSATDPVSIRVTTPGGQSRTVARSLDGTRVAFDDTDAPGVYRLSPTEEGTNGFADAFAANAPVEESDVTPAPPEAVESRFREKPVWLTDGDSAESDFGAALQERRLGRELSGFFLVAAALLALVESLWSNRLRSREEPAEAVGTFRDARSGPRSSRGGAA